MKHQALLLAALAVLVIFACRWFGPSDLYDNDQPKTVAYTVDMVRHGHWLLPVDMLGRPATKPPMYNWLGAPAVAMGWHNEFALKLPSTLAALITIIMTWLVAQNCARRVTTEKGAWHLEESDGSQDRCFAIGLIACICVVANYSFAKLCYTARPDMVLTAFLVGGWYAATVLLTGACATANGGGGRCGEPIRRGVLGMQAVLWLCVAGAALTKGPPALLLLIYVVLGAKWIGGRWLTLRRTGIVWGLPAAVGLIGLWAYGAYISNPQHFVGVFLGDETIGRVGRGGLLGIASEFWLMPALFVTRFAPWSVFALMGIAHAIAHRPTKSWLHNPLGPAVLWVFLVLVFFSLSGGKRADYLLPALPAGAVLASFWLVYEGPRRLCLRPWQVAGAGLAVAMVIAGYELAASPAARAGYGENTRAFVRQVRQRTGGQPIRFQETGYTPIQALLGYNQPEGETLKLLDSPWLVKPRHEPGAVVTSAPISVDSKDQALILALYVNKPPQKDRDAAP